MKILLANPRGFCAGVDRAIEIVERALSLHGAPVYVRNEVVHNKFVVNDLKSKGAIFVKEISEVPDQQVVIFSAHGVSQQVRTQAQDIKSIVYDATCPLVTKVHKEVARKQKQNHQVILIGHKGHPEVEGTLGQASAESPVALVENSEDIDQLDLKDGVDISYTTQTTLSVDDTQHIVDRLKNKFPHIRAPKKDDICYATQNRQDAVKMLMQSADVLLVLGSRNSSNSNRLREIAEKMKLPAYLIDGANEIKRDWIKNANIVGVTAGASAPEILVNNFIDELKNRFTVSIDEVEIIKENVVFKAPKKLN